MSAMERADALQNEITNTKQTVLLAQPMQIRKLYRQTVSTSHMCVQLGGTVGQLKLNVGTTQNSV